MHTGEIRFTCPSGEEPIDNVWTAETSLNKKTNNCRRLYKISAINWPYRVRIHLLASGERFYIVGNDICIFPSATHHNHSLTTNVKTVYLLFPYFLLLLLALHAHVPPTQAISHQLIRPGLKSVWVLCAVYFMFSRMQRGVKPRLDLSYFVIRLGVSRCSERDFTVSAATLH